MPDFSASVQRLRENDPDLATLQLNACGMQSEELAELGTALLHNNTLTHLSLCNNRLDLAGMSKFIAKGGLFNLTLLNLSGNALRDRAITMIAEALSESPTIRTVDLAATGMTVLSIHPVRPITAHKHTHSPAFPFSCLRRRARCAR